jgi:phosphoglycolate phosphatase-like HAD superfamily hydrolase
MATNTRLVIFDLDQTLVDFIPLHDLTVRALFRQEFGVEARLTEIDFGGRSLNDSFLQLARLKGVPEEAVRQKGGGLLEEYERIFAAGIPPDAVSHILPGVKKLLEALSGRDCVLALYSGDSPGVIKTALEATGLHRYFRFTFSGTEVEARAEMLGLAAVEVGRLTGEQIGGKDIVVIGDSVLDIDAAREHGARVIAIATGFHTGEQLREKHPDFLFKDMADTGKVLRAIGL